MQRGDVFAGRYVMERILGRGGFAFVFEALDRTTGRMVAVKVLDGAAATEPTSRMRFLREARSAAGIDHPRVVRIYDVAVHDQVPYLTMPLLSGGDLRGRLNAQQRLDPSFTVTVVEQVAEGLDVAHARGLVHRDVKPANIVFGEDGGAVVCDFGLAKPLDGSADFTSTGLALGTAAYMAPEQVLGGALSAATDVYALGCVAFHCLAGAPPFTGPTAFEMASARTLRPAPSLAVARPDLPPALVDAVDRALRITPTERWPSAGELAAAMRRGLPPVAVSPAGPEAVETTTAPLVSPGVPVVHRSARAASYASATVVLLATLIGGGLGLASGGENDGANAVPTALPGATGGVATETLRAMLPREVFRDCRSSSPQQGQIAALTCTPTDPGAEELLVRQFVDNATMATDFALNYKQKKDRYVEGKCRDFAGGAAARGTGRLSTWGPDDKAPLACYINDNTHAVVMWEYLDRPVQVLAIRKDADSTVLFAWWRRASAVPLR